DLDVGLRLGVDPRANLRAGMGAFPNLRTTVHRVGTVAPNVHLAPWGRGVAGRRLPRALRFLSVRLRVLPWSVELHHLGALPRARVGATLPAAAAPSSSRGARPPSPGFEPACA